MKPLDSANSGVIAPADQAAAAVDHTAAAAQQSAINAAQSVPSQGLVDVPLGQLPADMPPVEAPEFYLARKISEDSPTLGTVPAGVPGLSGNPASDPNDILAGIPSDVSSLLDGANAAIGHAAAPVLGAAQGVLGQAQGALGGGGGAAAAATPAAAALPDMSALPALPADPVAALMSGLSLPALPGVDMLFKPILDLLGSFGTGILGALDPTKILSESSKVIESAMQVGKGSMATVDQLWQGQAARNAQVAGQKANTEGQDTSQRGFDISDLTTKAAAVVQQGNVQLTGIATSFATQATALAPLILTPPAQASLIATATEHLGQAVSVANATRGDLAGKTAELTGLVNQLIAPGGLPQPQEVAQAVMQNIGEPIVAQAQDTATQAASALDTSGSGLGSPTNPASANPSTPGGSGTGSPLGALGSPSRSGSPSRTGSPGSPSSPSTPRAGGLPGAAVPPALRPVAGMPGSSLGSGLGTTPAGAGSSNFMGGGPAAAGQRGNDNEEHSRNVDPYQSRTGNDDLTGPLGESTPDVIGATHSDEMVSSDYEQDQF
ncbi:hypothetical protein ACFQZZ_06605 [Nocardia sp. GCM10030253]|uniref:hypothetical protein n=1 Tax=Nocardia sp. GCM10030253 TaxID=3273404 RepID=UPI0036350676